MGIETAILGSAIIGAGASLYGSSKAESGAKKAAKVSQQQYAADKAMLQPQIDQGANASKLYYDSIGANGPEAQQAYYANRTVDPAYQDANDFAMEGINRSAAARTGYGGNALAALYDYGQKNRFGFNQNEIQNLYQGGQSGQNAIGMLVGAGNTASTQQGNAFNNAGLYGAGGVTSAAGAVNQGVGNWINYNNWQKNFAAGASGNNPVTNGTGANGGWSTSTVPTYGAVGGA